MIQRLTLAVCISLIVIGGIAGSAQAYPAQVTFFFNGLDLDTGSVERDRTILLLIMGQTIEEFLRPAESLAEFSPAVDVSFEFDPTIVSTLDVVLQDSVKLAVLEDTPFDTVGGIMPESLSFIDAPGKISITTDDVVIAWTAEDRFFKIGEFSWYSGLAMLDAIVEDVEIIPEPASLFLISLGLIGVIYFVRRRRKILMILIIAGLATLWGAESVNAQAPITIKKVGPGTGTVLAGNQECGTDCEVLSIPYADNTAVLLKAISDPDSFFDRWETAEGNSLDGTFRPQPGDTVFAIFAASIEPDGGTVSDGTVSVDFPAGATSQLLYVSIVKMENGGTPISDAYEVRVTDAQGNPVTLFEAEVAVTLPYNPAAVGNKWGQLALYYYDDVSNKWIALPSTVDPENHTVTGFTTHFSLIKADIGNPSCQVTNGYDSDFGSLRRVLADAESNGCTTITFASNVSTISLSSQLEMTSGTLTIDGGTSGVTISGTNGTRVFYIHSGAKVTFTNLTITNGRTSSNGGGIFNRGTVTIASNTVVRGNTALDGGGIYNEGSILGEDGGTITIYGTVENNEAKSGGGISNRDGGTAMVYGTVENNRADISGGGIYNTGTIIGTPFYGTGNTPNNCDGIGCPSTASSCQVTNGYDSGAGSLRQVLADAESNGCTTITFANSVFEIRLESQLEITSGFLIIYGGASGVTVSGNFSTRVFGVSAGTNVKFLNLAIIEGKADYGGGIYNDGGTITIGDGTAISDNAAARGGGIYNKNGGTITIENYAKVINNEATEGGGIYSKDGGMITIDGTVNNNVANYRGGGIYHDDGMVTINGTVNGNVANSNGGGICNISGTVAVNGIFDNNVANNGNGGGIYNDSGTVTIETGAMISNNRATNSSGGGIYNNDGGTVTIEIGGRVINNEAIPGGGIFNQGTLTMNGTVSHNKAESGGGIANVIGMTFVNGTVDDNVANQGGGGISNYGKGIVTIEADAIISNNTAAGYDNSTAGYGGGIYSPGGGNVTVYGTVSGNTANYGGGIYNEDDGTVNIKNSGKVINNVANYSGGGISSWNGRELIINGTVGNNIVDSASGNGGGICISGGTITIENGGRIKENKAAYGGGIYIYSYSGGTVNIRNNGKVQNNKATEYGGGIHNSNGTVTIKNGGEVIDNKSYADVYGGGGIYNYNGTITIASGGKVSHNTAHRDGAGILNNGTVTIKNDGEISKNTAEYNGGGIYNMRTVTIENDGRINENTADSGGGIYNMDGGTVTIEIGGQVTRNIGGGISNAGILTVNGYVAENTAHYGGGGISNVGTVTIYGLVSKNTADNFGGGIYNNRGMVTIENDGEVSENSAERGGGISNTDGGTVTIASNGSVHNNEATEDGGGIYNHNGGAVSVYGTIEKNRARTGGGIYNGNGGTVTGTRYMYGIGNTPNNCDGTGCPPTTISCQVTNEHDSIVDSLREVLVNAERNGCTTITFANNVSEIKLENQLKIISPNSLTIDGKTTNGNVIISGQNKTRVFYVDTSAEIKFENLIITKGNGKPIDDVSPIYADGGGIYNKSGRIFIGPNTRVEYNNAPFRGGGIFNVGELILEGVISNNTAWNREDDYSGQGGGICNAGRLIIQGGEVSRNAVVPASWDSFGAAIGGGIYNTCIGILTIDSGSVSFNRAKLGVGGGIFNNGACRERLGKVTIKGGSFSNNMAGYGGGISNEGELILEGGKFFNNTAEYGGGIYNRAGDITFEKSSVSIEFNTADYGGGIYSSGDWDGDPSEKGLIWMKYGEIKNNTAEYGGGGICLVNTRADTWPDAKIIGNTARNGNGGGILIGISEGDEGMVNLAGKITNNQAPLGTGGGINITWWGWINLQSSGEISGNTAYRCNNYYKTDRCIIP